MDYNGLSNIQRKRNIVKVRPRYMCSNDLECRLVYLHSFVIAVVAEGQRSSSTAFPDGIYRGRVGYGVFSLCEYKGTCFILWKYQQE